MMHKRKLIEVALPLEAINIQCERSEAGYMFSRIEQHLIVGYSSDETV